MTKQERRADWLKWFKLAVTQARDARLTGNTQQACHLDTIVERYYSERADYNVTDDAMFAIESNIRGH